MNDRKNYEAWLHAFASDPETMAELKAIADDPEEIKDGFTAV
jgi:hypothetical protein